MRPNPIYSSFQSHPNQQQQPQTFSRKPLKIVAVSDTHGSYSQLNKILKMSGDIFIHGGDFTDYGRQQDFLQFFQFLKQLDFRHKIVISGNHEIMLDNGCISHTKKTVLLQHNKCSLSKQYIVSELKKVCIYLQHQSIQIQGIKIFGSPYTPYFVGNAFQYMPKDQRIIWDHLPQQIDLLVTHCPPYGIRDKNSYEHSCGSEYLREVSLKIKPKYHLFGHIHQSAGRSELGGIKYVNLANQLFVFQM